MENRTSNCSEPRINDTVPSQFTDTNNSLRRTFEGKRAVGMTYKETHVPARRVRSTKFEHPKLKFMKLKSNVRFSEDSRSRSRCKYRLTFFTVTLRSQKSTSIINR